MGTHRIALALLALLALFIGCEKPQPASPVTTAPSTAAQTVPAETPPAVEFVVGTFDASEVPQFVGVGEGVVKHGLRFADANGENLAVFWTDKEQGLFAKHILLIDETVSKPVRQVKQVRGDCEFDYSAEFVKGSIGATDLDGDGLGEVTFAYKFACRSDMSPQDYKLLVLENGEKSILRGTEIMIVGNEEPIGDGRHEAEGFDGAPKLLEHATKVWKRNVTTRY